MWTCFPNHLAWTPVTECLKARTCQAETWESETLEMSEKVPSSSWYVPHQRHCRSRLNFLGRPTQHADLASVLLNAWEERRNWRKTTVNGTHTDHLYARCIPKKHHENFITTWQSGVRKLKTYQHHPRQKNAILTPSLFTSKMYHTLPYHSPIMHY